MPSYETRYKFLMGGATRFCFVKSLGIAAHVITVCATAASPQIEVAGIYVATGPVVPGQFGPE